jgi:predicted acetyltransferase
VRIETKVASQMSAFERARTDCVVTSSLYAYQTGIKWASADWTVMVWEDQELVSNVHIIERVAKVDRKPVRLGGIGNVATKVEWRNRGFASAALKVAQEFLADPLKVDFGLMVCTEQMVPFYEKRGWKLVAQSLVTEQADGKKALGYPVMVLPISEKDWPKGIIDLCGLPW